MHDAWTKLNKRELVRKIQRGHVWGFLIFHGIGLKAKHLHFFFVGTRGLCIILDMGTYLIYWDFKEMTWYE
jgi:hypothetical protein